MHCDCLAQSIDETVVIMAATRRAFDEYFVTRPRIRMNSYDDLVRMLSDRHARSFKHVWRSRPCGSSISVTFAFSQVVWATRIAVVNVVERIARWTTRRRITFRGNPLMEAAIALHLATQCGVHMRSNTKGQAILTRRQRAKDACAIGMTCVIARSAPSNSIFFADMCVSRANLWWISSATNLASPQH